MGNVAYGIAGGLVATVVLSIRMLIKSAMGLMPELNTVQMLSRMGSNYLGLAQSPAIGWAAHFVIGTILWGSLFALLAGSLPGTRYWAKGVVFSIGAWATAPARR